MRKSTLVALAGLIAISTLANAKASLDLPALTVTKHDQAQTIVQVHQPDVGLATIMAAIKTTNALLLDNKPTALGAEHRKVFARNKASVCLLGTSRGVETLAY